MINAQEASFAPRLLEWYQRAGRKDLPWHRAVTPWRIWVSEIMLQQTQVTTVIPYFERFIERFPTIEACASAPLDEVLHLWTGLGYYARGRNLHRAAQTIVNEFNGEFPQQLDQVMALSGIGRSTAGAILAFSFGQRHPILDGNVKRVLTRWRAIAGWPGQRDVEKQLWELAERLLPASESAAYTQAMMDLGATLCTRSKPQCAICPLQADCLAYAANEMTRYPEKRPKAAVPEQSRYFLLLQQGDEILLQQRPPLGIWGGLFSLPEIEQRDALDNKLAELGLTALKITELAPLQHRFSHFLLTLKPLKITVRPAPATRVMEAAPTLWYNCAAPQNVGLAAPIKTLLQSLTFAPTR